MDIKEKSVIPLSSINGEFKKPQLHQFQGFHNEFRKNLSINTTAISRIATVVAAIPFLPPTVLEIKKMSEKERIKYLTKNRK